MASVGHAPATLVGITRRLSLSTRIPRSVLPYVRAPTARDGAPPISGARSAGPGMSGKELLLTEFLNKSNKRTPIGRKKTTTGGACKVVNTQGAQTKQLA